MLTHEGGEWPSSPAALKEESALFILRLMQERGVKAVLELGGGLGVTATRLACAGACVTTVERDEARAASIRDRALRCGVKERVHVVSGDALSPSLRIEGLFDLILIDAAKSEYQRLFCRYSSQLAAGGVIISDNMAFHGMVAAPSLTHNRSTKRLAQHLREYASFLRGHPDFATHYYDVGDGLAVSERKGDFAPLIRDREPLFSAGGVRYFALEQCGTRSALKVLPAGYTEAEARGQLRLLYTVHEGVPAALTPLALVRVGEGFALQTSPPPAMSFPCALKQAHTDTERLHLVRQLASLQRATARLDGVALPSYKAVLRAAAGGDCLEAAGIIRRVKRLPEGAGAVVLCDTLDELLVLEGGTVCYAGGGCLCRAPLAAAVCTTWLQLSPVVSPSVVRAYLDSALVVDSELAPFARVLQMLPPPTHLALPRR